MDLPKVTEDNANLAILKAGSYSLTLKDLKSIEFPISEEDKSTIMKVEQNTYRDGWMTDAAVFAYIYEIAANTKTRVFSTYQTHFFMKGIEKTVEAVKNARDDGEPSWEDTDVLLMPYNCGNHWVLLRASKSDSKVSCKS